MLPWDLEDWLTDEGDKVVRKAAVAGVDALTPEERLVFEVWLFDTEQRNGGVAHYFERGREQWSSLCSVARNVLAPFSDFAERVDAVVANAQEPYLAVIQSGGALDRAYEECQVALISALRENGRRS